MAARDGVPSADYIAAIHPDDQHIVVDATQHAIATAGPYVVEFRLPQKNAPDLWIYALGHAYWDEQGVPARFPGAAMDITHRKNLENELKTEHDRAQSILESITDGFFTLDSEFRFIYMNQAGEQILGARPEDLHGKSVWDAYPETVGTQIEKEYRRAMRDRAPGAFEWLFMEWQRWFAIKVYPTPDGGLSVYFRDITEQKKREELEHERQEQLRESARLESLGLMAGGIAHDFNNLLTAIVGNASLLARYATEKTAPFIDLQLGSSNCSVEADMTQIHQIILNLLLNAAEAATEGPGKVTIRTELIDRRPARVSPHLQSPVLEGRYVLLELRDNGIGTAGRDPEENL